MKFIHILSACFASAVMSAFTVAWFMAAHQHLAQYDEGFESGFAQGFKKGGDEALRTNPVSARLEHACTSIWISEQVVEQHKRGIK
jgi:flagellar biosynthesis/type III secretory pathway protein FliH